MRRLWICASLLALVFALALAPANALGAANHPFLGVVGQATYEDACGAAFGPGGLYVSDYNHDSIVGPSSIANEAPSGGPCKLAFDSAGDLYVDNWHTDVVRYVAGHLATGAYETIDPESPATAETPTGLAVDPETGDLYVAHRTFVSEYAAPVHEGEAPTRIGEDEHAAYYGIAFSAFPATKGYLYVPDAATNTVAVFDPATSTSTPIEAMKGEATPQGRFTYLIDSEALLDNNPTSPSYGHLYVLDKLGKGSHGEPLDVFDEFNSAGDYRGQIKGFEDAEPSGIAIEAASGDVYVTSGNSEGSAVFKYGPTAPALRLSAKKTGAGGGSVASSPAGIACGAGANCAAEYNTEENVTLYAAPDAHSDFSGWTVTGPGAQPCPGTGTCTVLLRGNYEVTADFEPAPQQSLEVSISGQGAVISEPAGISCPGHCTESFAEGRQVTLTAAPAPHSRIASWSGCASQPTPAQCTVTMSAASQVAVSFAPIPPQTLSVSLTGTGLGEVISFPAGISCPGTCAGGFDEGSAVTLTEITAPGSAFAGWGGACAGTATTCTVTMAEARSVGAGFASLLAPPPPAETPAGPGAPQSGPPSPPPAATGAQLSLVKLTVKRTSATLKLSISGPGSVSATGKGLKKAGAKASAAGALTLRLSLSRAGRRALAKAKHRRLKLELTLTFTPGNGAAAVALKKSVTFRA
jgi:DNA-binding beta-propeller fold protein YncE